MGIYLLKMYKQDSHFAWVGGIVLSSLIVTALCGATLTDPGIAFCTGEKESDGESGTVGPSDGETGTDEEDIPAINAFTAISSPHGKATRGRRWCNACQLWQHKGTQHCAECGVCIRGHDHHCAWMGKCIGERNLIWFYLYITLAAVCIVYDAMTLQLTED